VSLPLQTGVSLQSGPICHTNRSQVFLTLDSSAQIHLPRDVVDVAAAAVGATMIDARVGLASARI
jgi:hypothetical protein